MRKVARLLALLYAVVVCAAAIWAWYVDVSLLHVTGEHLLPDIVLLIVSLPTSNSLDFAYDHWPAFFSAPLMQLSWLTACGAFQVAVLYVLSRLVPKANGEA